MINRQYIKFNVLLTYVVSSSNVELKTSAEGMQDKDVMYRFINMVRSSYVPSHSKESNSGLFIAEVL